MTRQQLLARLEMGWTAIKDSFAGLTDAQLTEPGVMGDWSVKDMLAHVTTWEEEALKCLPLIIKGDKPPRYIQYGGIDAFNAQMTEQKQGLALSEVLRQLDATHGQLIDYLQGVPEEQFTRETRFRHRLRLDTSSHAPCARQGDTRMEGAASKVKEVHADAEKYKAILSGKGMSFG